MPIVDVEAGCASGGAALQLAAGAIRAGQYDCVLVFGIEKMPKGIIRSSFFEPWREEAGLAATPAYFALRAQRLMREAGLTKEHLARGRREEPAQRRAQPERHVPHGGHGRRGARVAPRVRAAAPVDAVLTQRGRGRGRAATRRRAASQLAAARLRSHLPGSVLGEATPLSGIDDRDITPPSTLAARDAYAEAGVGPDDLDVVECQDTDAARELLAYQELDLCAPGEPGEVARPQPACGPVNPSGGLLSKGEPLGASALGQVVEIVHQLRGEAGPRQVDGARVGLAHTVGRGANAACIIVTRWRARRNQPRGSQRRSAVTSSEVGSSSTGNPSVGGSSCHPHRARTSSKETPGASALTCSTPSRFSNVARSVTSACTRLPGDVTYAHSATVRCLVSVATITFSAAVLATSLPPPEPTRNGRGGIQVELMLPKRSTCAPPRQPIVAVPDPPTIAPSTTCASASIVAVGKLRWFSTNGSPIVAS